MLVERPRTNTPILTLTIAAAHTLRLPVAGTHGRAIAAIPQPSANCPWQYYEYCLLLT
jgi:hypothetical protein